MKSTGLLILVMISVGLTQGMGDDIFSAPVSQRCKLENSSSIQCGSAALLCGKPLAFRPGVSISLFPRRLEGAAFQTAPRRLVKIEALRKGEAFPHSEAAEPLVSTHQASDEQRNHGRPSNANHPPSRASVTKANLHKQLPNSRQRSISGNALHQQGTNKSVGGTRSGFIRNETVNNVLAIRTPSAVRPTSPAFNNVRHRSPNPAVVGGSSNSHSSNSGVISGTRMIRKP
jgi:hypothetical protein